MKQDPFSKTAERHGATPIRIPELGVSPKPISFLMWLVDLNAQVIPGERVAEILADGTVIHLDAPVGGQFIDANAQPGQQVEVDDVIGWIQNRET